MINKMNMKKIKNNFLIHYKNKLKKYKIKWKK